MSAPTVPSAPALQLVVDHTGRASSLICRGVLDARGAPRLRRAVDAALARPTVLVYLDLEDVRSVDATGARLVADTIRRCTSERVHLELWPGAAVERMLIALEVRLPRRAYPSRPCGLSAEPGSHRHPVWAIPPVPPRESMRP